MPVDHIAFGRIIDAPHVIQDLFARHQPSRVSRQQIQQTLLEGREMQLAGARPHLPVQDIDLQFTELDDGSEGDDLTVGSAHDRYGPGNQLFWGQGEGEDVVGAALEGLQLRAQIASSGKRDGWDTPGGRRCRKEAVQELSLPEVHIDDGELWVPLIEQGSRLRLIPNRTSVEPAVIESKADGLSKHWLVHDSHDPGGRARLPGVNTRRGLLRSLRYGGPAHHRA